MCEWHVVLVGSAGGHRRACVLHSTLKASIVAAPCSFSHCNITACCLPRLRGRSGNRNRPLSPLWTLRGKGKRTRGTTGHPRNTLVAVGRSGSLCGHLARPPPLTRSACQPEWREGQRKRWGHHQASVGPSEVGRPHTHLLGRAEESIRGCMSPCLGAARPGSEFTQPRNYSLAEPRRGRKHGADACAE